MITYNAAESTCPSARQHWQHDHLQCSWIYMSICETALATCSPTMQLNLHGHLRDNIPTMFTYNAAESTWPSARQHSQHDHLQCNWIYMSICETTFPTWSPTMQLNLHVHLRDSIPNVITYNAAESTCPSARQHSQRDHLQCSWIYMSICETALATCSPTMQLNLHSK